MKLQNFSYKFTNQEFIEATITAIRHQFTRSRSELSRNQDVLDLTRFRYFRTNSGDLYILLLSPSHSEYSEEVKVLLTDQHVFANSSRVLDICRFDVILSPRNFIGFPGYISVSESLSKDSVAQIEILNTVLEEHMSDLIRHVTVTNTPT